MATVALIARAAEPPVPELEPFRLPRGKPTAHRLAAAAHGMATAASNHADVFISAGLPDDFAHRMLRAADEMLETITEREKERVRHVAATHGIRLKLISARRVVRVLDAFVRTACEGDAAALAAWESATHVRRVVRHRVESAPADEATSAAAASTVDVPGKVPAPVMTGSHRNLPRGARIFAPSARPERAS